MPTPSHNEPPGPTGEPIINFSSCPEDTQQLQHAVPRSNNGLVPPGGSPGDAQHNPLPHNATGGSISSQQPLDDAMIGSAQSSSSHSSRDTTSSPHLSSTVTTLPSPGRNALERAHPKDDDGDAESRSRSPSSLDGSQSNTANSTIEDDEIASFQSEHSAPSLGPDYSTLRVG